MIILDDDMKQEDLKGEALLKLKLMRAIAIGAGYKLDDPSRDLNFTINSNFNKAADYILLRFDVKEKNIDENGFVDLTQKEENQDQQTEIKKKRIKKTEEENGN